MVRWLKLFYQRRIAVPLDGNGLMLDVGSGDKPHWRADVLVDKFTDTDHVSQRNLGGAVRADEPLFEAPLEDLPFRDDAFDFVYCSHVLEHVADPASAVSELMRVGKSGYIEVPFVGIQKIYDQETHLWFCDLHDETLTFTAKRRAVYDLDISRFLGRGPFQPLAVLMNFFPDAAMIRVHWSKESPVSIKVIGTPNLRLSEPLPVHGNASRAVSGWGLVRAILRLCYFRKVRRNPITFNAIVKDRYHRTPDETLSRDIYRLRTDTNIEI